MRRIRRFPPSDAESLSRRSPLQCWSIQESGLGHDQQTVAALESAATAIRSIQWYTVEHCCADDDVFDGFEGDADAQRRIREDRRSFRATLGELQAPVECRTDGFAQSVIGPPTRLGRA